MTRSSIEPNRGYLAAISGALFLIVVGSWLWNRHLSQEELLALPMTERQSYYEHTLEALATLCAHASASDLGDHCREQAAFLSRFPECDTACQEVCRRFSPRPTK